MSKPESIQPRKNYSFSSNIDDGILAELGVIKGFEHFNHRFQRAENVIDLVEWLQTCKENGVLINKHSLKPIKTDFDPDVVWKLFFVWKRNGFLLTQLHHREITSTSKITFVKWIKYLYEEPEELEKDQEKEKIPSLRNMKPNDLTTSQEYLIRIRELVPVNLAFEGEDPIQLSKSGMMQYEWQGKIYDMFETKEDIEDSIDFTKEVSRNFYDQTTNILFDQFDPLANNVMVTAFKMMKEIRRHGGSDSKQRTSFVDTLGE